MTPIAIDDAIAGLLRAVFTPPRGRHRCPACERRMVADAFYNDRSRHSGLSVYCKDCLELRHKAYRVSQPQHKRAARMARNSHAAKMARKTSIRKERARQHRSGRNEVVAKAIAIGSVALARLAAGLTVDGRRTWLRPDRRAAAAPR